MSHFPNVFKNRFALRLNGSTLNGVLVGDNLSVRESGNLTCKPERLRAGPPLTKDRKDL